MTKLNKKLSICICIAVIVVSIASLAVNKLFVHKYYLYEKKKIINQLGKEVEKMTSNKLLEEIDYIEDKNNVTIVYAPININSENIEDEISETISNELYKKGISLKKFWISKEALTRLNIETVNKIFNQGKSKYSLLVKFIKKENTLFAIATTIEHSQETIKIINRFYAIMSVFSVVIISILTFILSNKIIKPITKLKILSQDISMLNFRTEEIKTNDEIEDLANSINKMSVSLEKAQKELNNRNENLKRFISDASHEMKTPVALIKAYAIGIQDGIDDGTYLNTIVEQSENLTNIINTLLYWAKYEQKEFNRQNFDLKNKVNKILDEYEIIIKDSNIDINIKFDEEDFIVNGDVDSIEIVLNNLLSNAIKYNNDNNIDIFLLKNKDEIFLSIRNGIKNIKKEDVENIWMPFYVLEKSRNKDLSGTGLGLSIVKEILDAHKYEYGVDIKEDKIEFYIIFHTIVTK